jgi:hypothetical protein
VVTKVIKYRFLGRRLDQQLRQMHPPNNLIILVAPHSRPMTVVTMCFQLLQMTFSIGKIFSVPPSSVDVPLISSNQKIRAVVVLNTILSVSIAMLLCKNFYLHFIHIKRVIWVLNDVILQTFYFVIVTDVNFFKRYQWTKLLKNLKITKPESGNCKKTKGCIILTFANAAFLTATIYTIILWIMLDKIYLFEYGIDNFRNYILYIYNFLICVIVKILGTDEILLLVQKI